MILISTLHESEIVLQNGSTWHRIIEHWWVYRYHCIVSKLLCQPIPGLFYMTNNHVVWCKHFVMQFSWVLCCGCLVRYKLSSVRVYLSLVVHRVTKLVAPVSNMPNSVCSAWTSTKYLTLHCLNVTYCHAHYDVRTLPCVLNVTSLWCHSLFTLSLRSVHCYWQRD